MFKRYYKMSLLRVIKNIEQQPITGDYLHKIIPQTTKIIAYHELRNTKSMYDLLGSDNQFILLLESEYNTGHFVAVIYHTDSNTLEWFDPYGKTHDQLINKGLSYYTNNGGEYFFNTLLFNFIQISNCKYSINKNRYQLLKNNSQTCGRHSGFRLVLSKLHNDQYNKAMQELKSHYNIPYDDLIVLLTMLSNV